MAFVISGLLLFAAGVETFLYSRIFWLKMGLMVLLLINGALLLLGERQVKRGVNLFYSFLAGCLLFSVIYAFAWVRTSRDPQMLQILLRSGQSRARYDAAKHEPFLIEVR